MLNNYAKIHTKVIKMIYNQYYRVHCALGLRPLSLSTNPKLETPLLVVAHPSHLASNFLSSVRNTHLPLLCLAAIHLEIS